MAETAHTAWYRQGTVTVTNGSTKVSGNGTRFLTAGINPGAAFRTDARGDYACEVASVVSDTEIQLVKPYYGQSASGQTYSIDRNHQSTLEANLAARLSKAMGNWEARYDTDVAKITGKSAYELAVEEGYVGTVAQWLASLKATTELTALKALVDPLLVHNSGAHNAMYRGNDLGVFSDAQSAAIRAGTFSGTYGGVYADVYPGDYWVFSNIAYSYLDENDETQSSTYSGTMRVADLDYYLRAGDSDFTTHHIVVVPDSNMFTAPMNETNTTEGGYVGSKMRTKYLRRAEAIFKACFGEDHVLSHREYLVNAVTNGRPSAGAWCDSVVELMDERMVYGSCIFDSANTDGTGATWQDIAVSFNRYSVSHMQLAAFRHKKVLVSNRQWYWLRNVVSPAIFANVHGIGYCNFHYASYVNGVRPAALIY